MAFRILLETRTEPRIQPRRPPRRWRERNGVLFIKRKPGRKSAARMDVPSALVLQFPKADFEPLLQEHARVLWAVDKILYPDDEEVVSLKQFMAQIRRIVVLGPKPVLIEPLRKFIQRQLADGKRCLEDYDRGAPLEEYYAMPSLAPIQRAQWRREV